MEAITGLSDSAAAVLVAILAAVFAALGYVGKLIVEAAYERVDRRNARRAKLVELDTLLRASRAVYETQNELARRLDASILTNHTTMSLSSEPSFEDTFAAAYDDFSPEEKALHGLIRSMTENAVRPLNRMTLAWLRADKFFRAQRGKDAALKLLASKLADLEAHLHMWHAKQKYWLQDPRHALVYLVDEAKHGVGFPKGLDAAVKAILSRDRF